MTLRVNGEVRMMAGDARTTVLDALCEHLGLTGSKEGCDHSQCRACTVLMDGRRVVSCLTLAAYPNIVAAVKQAVETRCVLTPRRLLTPGKSM